MQTNDLNEALTYVRAVPNVAALKNAYDTTINDLDWYLQSTRDSYDYRRNIWPGKSKDLRKHGSDAFPFEGAADSEVQVIDERINTYVALFMSALNRAHIRAYPIEIDDLGRARVVSAFLKWMVASYIPDFKRQMELGANYLLERGIMVTYIGWQKENRTFLQRLDLAQIAQVSPDLAQIILDGKSDEQVVQLLKGQFDNLTDKRAKKALKELRKEGSAEFPVVRQSVNCPKVAALAPDGDVFFPAYTTDPQKAPYCFWRVLMTAQEIKNKVATEGWDSEWADKIIEMQVTSVDMNDPRTNTSYTRIAQEQTTELYEVIYCYQRLISEEDKSEGIYCTVFHNNYYGTSEEPKFAKHELLNGYDDYPFVVTKLGEDNKRLYELATVPEQLRGIQWQVKVERDSRIDRNSYATLPAIMYPAGTPAPEWGPGVKVAYRRMGEIQFGPTPAYNPGSVEMERTQIEQADRLMGLDHQNPMSRIRQQFFVDKFLTHVRDVLRMTYKCYQRFGPEQVFFRVTGNPDPVRFGRGDPNENFDININFDVLTTDPETLEAQLNQFVSLLQFDRNGRINVDRMLEVMAAAVNPLLADSVLQPAQEAQQQIVKQVTDDLSKIYAGIEVGARPNGAQVAMQVIQQYVQQPDVSQRMQSDESFQARLQKYIQQYQFQMQQAQNAQIGRIGTQPAQMGEVQTQGLNATG
jgi:hypothetical protein